MWRVRAACHHAKAVRDEEEVGDRDGVAIGLEHTLLIGCMIYGYTGYGYASVDEMQMECIYCKFGYVTLGCMVLLWRSPAASIRAAPRPRHRTPPATLAALRRRRQRRGVASGRAPPTAV